MNNGSGVSQATMSQASPHVNRSCEPCRLLKIRCLPDKDSASGNCQRCGKTGQVCHYAAPKKRRLRKRTDTRVAELEMEVIAMRDLLRKSTQSATESFQELHEPSLSDADRIQEDSSAKSNADRDSRSVEPKIGHTVQSSYVANSVNEFSTESRPVGAGNRSNDLRQRSNPDVVDQGIVSLARATELFEFYNKYLVQHLPVVVFDEDETFLTIRLKKPVLALAVITAAAGKVDSDLYNLLHEEMLKEYADRVIIKLEKSLELVQSMLITCVWHYPPYKFNELKYYQYSHMAAIMAIDIGITSDLESKGTPAPRKAGWKEAMTDLSNNLVLPHDMVPPVPAFSSEHIECRRTFLACYLLCAGIAMSMRRQSILRFSSWCSDCVDFFEKIPNALTADKIIVAWVKLQHIADQCGVAFGFDDPRSDMDLSEPRMQITLHGFKLRFDEWKNAVEPGVMNVLLAINMHTNNIYFHEFAMLATRPADFNPSHLLQSKQRTPNPLSQAATTAVLECVDSTHAVLDAFIGTDVLILNTLPVIAFVRTIYSLILVMKISVAVTLPNSELGKVLSLDSLKVDYYLNSMYEKLELSHESKKNRVTNNFLRVVKRLSEWYHKNQAPRITNWHERRKEQVEPQLNLGVRQNDREELSTSTGLLDASAPVGQGGGTYEIFSSMMNGTNVYRPMSQNTVNSRQLASGRQPPSISYMENASMSGMAETTLPLSIPTLIGTQDESSFGENQAQQSFQPVQDLSGLYLPIDMDLDFFSLYSGMGASVYERDFWLPENSYEDEGQDWNVQNA